MCWNTELAFVSCCLIFTQAYSGLAIAEAADSQAPSFAQDTAISAMTNNSHSPATKLQGNIEHSERVQPIDPQLQPGLKANFDTLPKLIPGNNWVRIPAWFAGTWHSITKTQTYSHLYAEGVPENIDNSPRVSQDEVERIRGHQRDRNGQIWHYCGTPYNVFSKMPEGQFLSRVLSFEFVASNEDQIICRNFGQNTLINPHTLIIIKSVQQEGIDTFTPVSDGIVHLSSSAREFNALGTPFIDEKVERIQTRIKPFKVVDEREGRDLKQLFRDFLRANNKVDLIP